MTTRKPILTGDNSKTLLIPELNESYHSRHGAITESRHIFIESGLRQIRRSTNKTAIEIFELGFGTGLNALLTYLYNVSGDDGISIKYSSIEKYPLQYDEVLEMSYPNQLGHPESEPEFQKMHSQVFTKRLDIANNFELYKYAGDFLKTSFSSAAFDLIYFDAFAPKIQPELWTEEIFVKIADMMKVGGILVSYCAQGQFRRNLKAAGLKVERLAGPPGKREITRAYK